MTEVLLIGIGAGDAGHLTLAAIEAINSADLILVPDKGAEKADLAAVRRSILERVLTRPVPQAVFRVPVRDRAGDYAAGVEAWHAAVAAAWAAAIAARRPAPARVALLVWGDPALYDSSLRIAARLGLAARVVPGITSLQALCAAHAVPLNTVGGAVLITTGRRLRAEGWPAGVESLAVMLDEGGAYAALDPEGITIWWGACLGLPWQALEAGPLAEAAPRIAAARAAIRAAHGWVMDVYLMRRA
ncbi:MAG: precorrin-6A synthase (deacetylating) [Rhodobacteraceae bacterium]|nr:precorrin-6A synthase (deacetylating) [Paracoccaceae bacterium]